MARANCILTDDQLKMGIEIYTEASVSSFERHDDVRVAGAIALRATLDYGAHVEFLIDANAPALMTPDDVADALQEVEFTEWPPAPGKLKFF